jgi:hypothetical protein
MSHHDRDGFVDRRRNATEAKRRLLRSFEMAPKADDPDVVARRCEREATSKAREERRAKRERLRQEEHERQLSEAAARAEAAQAEATAELAARDAAEKDRIARVISDQAERKAERDRRYAARKARQR